MDTRFPYRTLCRAGAPARRRGGSADPVAAGGQRAGEAGAPHRSEELAEGEGRRSHQNCERKRVSLVKRSRRSSTPWRVMARRSMPKPKAKPCHSSGSMPRSEEHTSELQSLMRISYAVFCLKKKNNTK